VINSQNFKMDRRIFLKSSSVALAAVTLESKRLAGLAPLTLAEADPDRVNFANLPHPPFQVDLNRTPTQDLRIEAYLDGKKVIEKKYSSGGAERQFLVVPDDLTLVADDADATRVVLRVTDEFGNLLRYTTAAIAFKIAAVTPERA
jgi:hypothetical protein